MTFTFTLRVLFYYHMIFTEIYYMLLVRAPSFLAFYPPFSKVMIQISCMFYVVLFMLQLFWYKKMILGVFKVLGLTSSSSENKEKPVED